MPFRDNVKRYGLVRTAVSGILRRLVPYFEIWSVQTRPMYPDFRVPAEHAERFEFKRLSREDALAASRKPDLLISEAFVEEAFARGDFCEGTFDGADLVAYTWRTTSHAPVIDDLWLRLHGDGVRYGYKSLVLPDYRGMRLNTSNARVHDHLWAQAGVNTDIGYVAQQNMASMKSTYRDPERAYVGFAGYVKGGRRFFTFRSRGVREYLSFEQHVTL